MKYLLETILILGCIIIGTAGLEFNFDLYCQLTVPSNPNVAKNAGYYCNLLEGDQYCTKKISPYFKAVEESENSIRQFVDVFCKGRQHYECTNGLIKLQNSCYDMERAVELSKIIVQKSVFYTVTDSKFDLRYFEYEKYTSSDMYSRIKIGKCIGDLTNALKSLKQYYLPWLIREDGNADCNCQEIMGLEGFFPQQSKGVNTLSSFLAFPSNDPEKTSAKGNTNKKEITLYSIYKDFCYFNNKSAERSERYWNKNQVYQIATSRATYDEKLKLFLKGSIIGQAGWWGSSWSADFIISHLAWSESVAKKNYEEVINLMAESISMAYTEEEFLFLTNKLANDKFLTIKCVTSLLNDYNKRDYDSKKIIYKFSKIKFITTFVNLSTIFKKSNPKGNCSEFVKSLPPLLEEVFKLNLPYTKIATGIENAIQSNTKFDDVLQTLKK